jgi:chloramphenicol O-acetyltransferase type A
MEVMTKYLDIENWYRRPIFNFFKDYDNPFFNVCVQVDVTALLNLTRAVKELSFTLAYHFLALKAVNELEPFHYRLRGERVVVYERIHAGTTVLLDDGRFTFCYFDYDEDFGRFQAGARASIEQARAAHDRTDMGASERDDMIHCSVLPWLSFTSISHARRWGSGDSVPKFSFGKHYEEGGIIRMPLSVEVHHALMDGLDVGRYFELVGNYFSEPSKSLGVLSETL